ncbi:MAG TPA: WD40 repeat domain-containing protein [Gemmataceae bacterium]|nr:WD40 repeat domain-containing protein [Gemmataceae bacterium]
MQHVRSFADSAIPALGESRTWLAVLFLAASLCVVTTFLGHPPVTASQPEIKQGPPADRYGDPLSKGALARLGTLRLHHPGPIDTMIFSPDGKTLATSGHGSVCLWDWVSGKELPRLPAANVGTVAFSADSKLLATASDREKIRLWDIEKTKEVGTLEVRRKTPMIYRSALSFAEGGKVLVYAGDDGVVQGWEVQTGKERLFFKLPKHDDIISAVAMAPGGKIVAYAVRSQNRGLRGPVVEGTKAGPVCLVDTATGKERHRLSNHKQPIWSLAFSPDGTLLASASTTEAPILWEVATGKFLRRLQGKEHDPQFLTFSPDGRILASGDSWNKLRLWDVATGKQLKGFESKLLGTFGLAFSQDGKTLAVADGNAIRLLNSASGKEIKPQAEPTSAIHSVGWLPDGKTVALGTEDAVWLREAATGKALRKLWHTPKPLFGSAAFFAISTDGKYFGLAGGASIQLFDTASRKPLHQLVGSNQVMGSFVFSGDSKTVAAAVGYDVVYVWDAATGKRRYHLEGKRGTDGAALSPDGKTIATTYASNTGARSGIQLWDQASGKVLRDLPINKAWVPTLAFSADSKTLAALTDSQWADRGGLILWDLPAGIQRFRLPKVDAIALAFSPDDKLVACEAREHAVCVLDAKTGKVRHSFAGHRARVSALAFSPDGKMLVSGSWDATALVWDIAALKRR